MSLVWLLAVISHLPAPQPLPSPQPGGFHFKNIEPWKWSEGRQEKIPALSADLDNRTGQDWEEVRFHVIVTCAAGGERAYGVRLREVLQGKQKVAATAFDFIGRLEACDGPASVEFAGGKQYEESRRPSFVILGFSMEYADGSVTTDLEGILDHRRSESRAETHRLYWQDGGWKVAAASTSEVGFYCLRVEPGELGLAGFLLNRDPQSTGPTDRFLRFFPAPAGKTAYLGIFRVANGPGLLRSVGMEAGEEYLEALRAASPREVVAVRGSKPKIQGILTVEK